MRWGKFFKVDFIISLILSFGFMIWRRIKFGKFVNALSSNETIFKTWITQTVVILIVIFIFLFILALIWNILAGRKGFVKGVAIRRMGHRKMAREYKREKKMKKMKINPGKMIRI
ncbi:hypothetical protein KY317_01015 [Candidatus Woesearchaeota archaeon]|nr:hypothetical protein [Candidatus Woesearchaeota archaeon]